MLVIQLRFVCGRFHATPWGRHVNEGVPEWPPSPYRLVRALYDAWRRKRPDWEESRVERVLAPLASAPPRFRLPAATAAHTRNYLSKNTPVTTDKSLIFDAFVAVSPDADLRLGWPGVELDTASRADLTELLSLVNYLGRSESWVELSIAEDTDPNQWNCWPEEEAGDPEKEMETVQVACLTAREQYSSEGKTKKGKTAAAMSWMEAVAYSTPQLLQDRRSNPPAYQTVPYLRQVGCFTLDRPRTRPDPSQSITTAVYALQGKVLPRVTETLRVAEQVRTRLMGSHRLRVGDPGRVSNKFSGKQPDGSPLQGHRHCYIWPQDRDQDGRLDHLLIWCREPFDSTELSALDGLRALWQSEGRPEVRCVLVSASSTREASPMTATVVGSRTPYVPTRHWRKGRGSWPEWLLEEVKRECQFHGIQSSPRELRLIESLELSGGHQVHWVEFRRQREEDARRPGLGLELVFDCPVAVPFSLGYGAHFGLGQFTRRS